MSQQTSDMTGGQKSPDATQNKPTNTNVFHPNYIKRSADFSSNKKFNNRKKRSNNEDDDADDGESEKDETNDDTNNEDLSMDLNTLVEPNDNKLATNNEQLKSTTASPVVLNDEAEETQNIEDLNETEESDSFASIGQVKDENSNENRQDEKFDEDELKDKVTTPNAKLKIENEKSKL